MMLNKRTGHIADPRKGGRKEQPDILCDRQFRDDTLPTVTDDAD